MPPTQAEEASLPLHQVLEEEYERLHQEQPPSQARPDVGGRSDKRLAGVFNDIHLQQHKALCLSGGGIRSATFALGVLQGLARVGLLDQFHYLSTVSGGGYVGGWLSAWIHRHKRGVSGVMDELNVPPSTKIAPEPEPILHLRSYSNYLTPRLGFFSADTWTMIAIVLRNLVLNWLVLLPLVLAVLTIPRIALAVARLELPDDYRPWLLGAALLAGLVGGVVSVAYAGIKRPSSTRDYNTWKGFLVWCLLPLFASAISLTTFWVWYRRPGIDVRDQLRDDVSPYLPSFFSWHYSVPFIAFGVALYVAGWLIYSAYHGRFSFWRKGWSERVDRFKFYEFGSMLFVGFVGGLFLWLVAAKGFDAPDARAQAYVAFSAPIFLALFLMIAILFAGISSEFTQDEDREWWARFSAWVLIAMLGWGVVSFLVLIGPELLLDEVRARYLVPAGGLIGLLTTYLAHSAKAPPNEKQEKRAGWRGLLMRHALSLGSLIFIALLIVLLSIAANYLLAIITLVATPLFIATNSSAAPLLPRGDWWLLKQGEKVVESLSEVEHGSAILGAPLPLLLFFAAFILLVGIILSRRINTNKFSYHAMYRNRLIRAYLGASNNDRDPNPFTGFDSEDNIPMHELRPEMFHPGSFTDIGKFVARLKAGENAIYKEVRDALSSETRKHLAEHEHAKFHPKKVLQRALISDLNGERFVLKADPLLDDFSGLRERLGMAVKELREKEQREAGLGSKEREELNELESLEKLYAEYASNKRLRPDKMALLNRRALELALPGEFNPCREATHRPLHVVNIALNLVRGTNLAWQDRKAESFTVSPLHCGSCQIPDFEDDEEGEGDAAAEGGAGGAGGAGGGATRRSPGRQTEKARKARRPVYGSYRRSRVYGGKDSGGISLGTAVAVSGAAVSPNMGYYSSPLVTFLMTLFNVRLGWWLGNPGKAGDRGGEKYYEVSNPKSSAYPIVAEALGLTDDENAYVYLSDGGHFENLGLYEMVLRRNSLIVVCDASDDFDFKLDNLGNAIRKIRIDFGIPIEFTSMFIYPRSKGQDGAFCAVGRVEYSRVDKVTHDETSVKNADNGTLIYIKPVFYGGEPRDIYHYAQANERFPHESTADQWFSEEQFESYRSLGMYTVGKIVGDEDPDSVGPRRMSLDDFRQKAADHIKVYADKQAGAAGAKQSAEDFKAVLAAAVASLNPQEPSPASRPAAAEPPG